MLNRHAIVLFLGMAALTLLRPVPPPPSIGSLGAAFVVLTVGLLFDPGQPGASRTLMAHGLQGTAALLLFYDAIVRLTEMEGQAALAVAELGVASVAIAIIAEMRLPYAQLRLAIGAQVVGDVLLVVGLVLGFTRRAQPLSVFVAVGGAAALYAALGNIALQWVRLKDPQAGWRFRADAIDAHGIALMTPDGAKRIPWTSVEAVKRLDDRQLVLVVPNPVPGDFAGLPLEMLDRVVGPAKYGLVLHEQELGGALNVLEPSMKAFIESQGASR